MAREGGTISYEDLVADAGIPPDLHLAPLLREISTEEDAAGRGMLTAVVVRRSTGLPGGGFFDLAARLGRDTTDRDRCWRDEHARVVLSHARGTDQEQPP